MRLGFRVAVAIGSDTQFEKYNSHPFAVTLFAGQASRHCVCFLGRLAWCYAFVVGKDSTVILLKSLRNFYLLSIKITAIFS